MTTVETTNESVEEVFEASPEESLDKERFKRVERIERFNQFIRLRFNTYMVTALTLINVLILGPIAFITWLFPLMDINFEIQWFTSLNWPVFFLLCALPLFTWYYSTITFPIKDGHKIILDWSKTKGGRLRSAILNIPPFFIMLWAANTKFANEEYVNFLLTLGVEGEKYRYYMVKDLETLVTLIYIAPVLITAVMLFAGFRHFQIHSDILVDQFFKWEGPLLARFSHAKDMDSCDVITGYDFQTKKPIVIKEDQRYLHEGSFGATGSGKTSTSILLRITQDLIQIATGRRKMGLVFLEPKGDGVDDVLTLAKKLGIPDDKIMVIDPTKSFSTKYNPFAGPLETAAASFSGTLNALTGDQDAFFKDQQNEAAQTYTLLAKIRYQNLTNITHIQRMFTDPRYLANVVEDVRKQITDKRKEPDLDKKVIQLLNSYEGVVRYFENEVLDYKTYRNQDRVLPLVYGEDSMYYGKQVVENKKDKFVTGAKKYLNDIAMNSLLSELFVSAEGEKVFDADEFLKNGGVLLINTALAELEELSLMFGQFFIRQFQSAVFRRPKEGRIPIFLYVDEFPLYVNESFERLLTLGRSYKVGTLIAMQSLGQLDNVVKGFKETVLSNASSKTVFGRGTVNDNKYFSEEFGEELVVEESLNESASPMTTDGQTWGYRFNSQKKLVPRFTPTDIRELPFKHMIMQVVNEENSLEVSTKVIGKFVHEASFIKSYLRVGAEELKSTKEKEFSIDAHLSEKDNVQFSFDKPSEIQPYSDNQTAPPAPQEEEIKQADSLEQSKPAKKSKDNPIPANASAKPSASSGKNKKHYDGVQTSWTFEGEVNQQLVLEAEPDKDISSVSKLPKEAEANVDSLIDQIKTLEPGDIFVKSTEHKIPPVGEALENQSDSQKAESMDIAAAYDFDITETDDTEKTTANEETDSSPVSEIPVAAPKDLEETESFKQPTGKASVSVLKPVVRDDLAEMEDDL